MPDLKHLHEFFDGVLAADEIVLHRIETGPENAWVEQRAFVFSLAALLTLLDSEGEMTLKAFKKLIYSSELNRELSDHGAEITLFRSTGKVDSNLYCLKAT